jgi:hypothetical protein
MPCASPHRLAFPKACELLSHRTRLDRLQHVIDSRNSDQLRFWEPSLPLNESGIGTFIGRFSWFAAFDRESNVYAGRHVTAIPESDQG